MIRKLLLPTLAAVLLGGCVTGGYQYRGGPGDYYYGQPSVDYRYYGAPYYDYGYPGYGYAPYGYYGYPGTGYSIYGFYGYGYPYYRNRFAHRGPHWRPGGNGPPNHGPDVGPGRGVDPGSNAPDTGVSPPRNRGPIPRQNSGNGRAPVAPGTQSQSQVRDQRRIHKP